MSRTPLPSVAEQVTSRRAFLAGLSGCAVAGVLAGCEVAEVSSGSTGDAKELSFKTSDNQYAALSAAGGMAAANAGTKKLLLIRTDDSTVVALDRVCTHAFCEMNPGGIGNWDAAKSVLRCGCHGSEFRPDGTYVDGSVGGGGSVADLGAYPVTFDASAGTGTVTLGG